MKLNCTFLIAAGFAAALQVAGASDIVGTVTLNGTPPPENDYTALIKADPICGKLHEGETVTTHFYVVGKNHGLADVVVMLKGVTGKSTGASAPPAVLDQKGCEYVPQIMAIQTNQKLVVKNSDPVAHNIHVNPTISANESANLNNQLQPQGAPDLTLSFPAPENFMMFKCDVHKWMRAWVTVVDNPYFAVTDKDGNFKISNVPPGKYTIAALHRKAAPTGMDKQIEVKEGELTKVDFTLEVPTAK